MIRRFVVQYEIVERLLYAWRHVAVGRERADEVDQHGTEVGTVATQHRRSLAFPKEKGENWHVGFGAITVGAGEHEVVAPVVGTLPSSRGNVVQGNGRRGDAAAAVCADRAVLLDEPPLGFRIRRATRGC